MRGREPSPWVIQDLSFSVRHGELLTLIGPSGAGKSTLLNIIAQIDTASAGEIVLDGTPLPCQDPRALRPGVDHRIGYVTQDDNLLPWRSTLDNVLFPLAVQGNLTAATRARAEMLIAAVGLAGYERYYPHELSGGMRKRTALIRTLVYDPPIILLCPLSRLEAGWADLSRHSGEFVVRWSCNGRSGAQRRRSTSSYSRVHACPFVRLGLSRSEDGRRSGVIGLTG